MAVVTNIKLIEELDKLSNQNTGIIETSTEIEGTEVKDENIIKELSEISEGSTLKGKITSAFRATKDFFSGTKRTEFPEFPEIGELETGDAKATAAIVAGTLINPNQQAQAQIIQSQLPNSKIFQDKFDNLIVTTEDGKSFYLNKPGASPQDFIQTTSQILSYIPGYSFAVKKAGKNYVKRALGAGSAGGVTSVAQDVITKPLGAEDIDVTRAVVSTLVPVAFEGAINPVVSTVYKKIFGNPTFTKTVTQKIDGVDVKKVILNERGIKAAKAAGIDPNIFL